MNVKVEDTEGRGLENDYSHLHLTLCGGGPTNPHADGFIYRPISVRRHCLGAFEAPTLKVAMLAHTYPHT